MQRMYFPQIKTIASLSDSDINGNATINVYAMVGTIDYKIANNIDENISIEIMSVATNKIIETIEEEDSVSPRNKKNH